MKKNLFLILILILLGIKGNCQISPVQSQTFVFPPYSLCMSDYLTSSSEKMVVQVNMKDLSVAAASVKLRLIIESNQLRISTSPFAATPIYKMSGGDQIRLANSELSTYFQAANLDFQGYSKSQYINSGSRLPEGNYKIWFEAYELNSGKKVSASEGFAMMQLYLWDPPQLNQPQNQSVIFSDQQAVIRFQWSPRHPLSEQLSYNFEMVEIPDNFSGDSKYLFDHFKKFLEHQVTTNYFSYDFNFPALRPGYHYAFRVKVLDEQQRNAFKNNGYSEVFQFYYKEQCPDPEQILIEQTNSHAADISWKSDCQSSGMNVKVRKNQAVETAWFSYQSNSFAIEITDLSPETTYECIFQNQCQFSESEWSKIYTFATTAEPTAFSFCSMQASSEKVLSKVLLEELKVGDTVRTFAGVDVEIIKVGKKDGGYTGCAKTRFPLFQDIEISLLFKGITVNENYQLLSGKMDVEYKVKKD